MNKSLFKLEYKVKIILLALEQLISHFDVVISPKLKKIISLSAGKQFLMTKNEISDFKK